MVLPYINMNPLQVYMCSLSWTPLPPPSPYHPSGSSQCTSPKHPVSLSQLFTLLFCFHQEALYFFFTFCHKGGIICISEVTDISLSNLDSSLCSIQPSISHDVLCIEVKQTGWQYTALMYSFPNLEPVCCSVFGSNWCLITCIQFSQEAGQVVWYSHLFRDFPQFVVIHAV